MKRIAVLGATGRTGVHVVDQGLAQNHHITAVVRNPDKVTTQHENLKVVKASIFSEEELAEAFKDHDAVMSCLNVDPSASNVWKTSTFYEDNIKPIVGAMRKSNVKRLIYITSIGTRDDPSLTWYYRHFIRHLIKRSYLNSMAALEDYLVAECQDLDFTCVRPPGLTNGPLKEGKFMAAESQAVPPGASNWIPRANVAKFMLQLLTTDEWNKKLIAVGLKK